MWPWRSPVQIRSLTPSAVLDRLGGSWSEGALTPSAGLNSLEVLSAKGGLRGRALAWVQDPLAKEKKLFENQGSGEVIGPTAAGTASRRVQFD